MSQKCLSHSDALAALLSKERKKKYLSVCIRDIVTNGIVSARFRDVCVPEPHELKRYLAAWFDYIGISPDSCLKWMRAYCSDVLADNRYVLISDAEFDCGCEDNLFGAPCRRSCPLYAEMYQKYTARKTKEASEDSDAGTVNTPVKGKYIRQFEEARNLILRLNDEGFSRKEIVQILNEQGFKTRTGRVWTYPLVCFELETLLKNTDFDPRRKYSPLKDKYREQFREALDSAITLLEDGLSLKNIVGQMNSQGFKTRTGRPWTTSLLRIELSRLKSR